MLVVVLLFLFGAFGFGMVCLNLLYGWMAVVFCLVWFLFDWFGVCFVDASVRVALLCLFLLPLGLQFADCLECCVG